MQRLLATPLNRIAALIGLLLILYAARLYWLQVVEYEAYATAADNYLVRDPVRPLRGEIYARDGKILVGNRAAVDLVYHGGEVQFFDRISRLAGIAPTLPAIPTGQTELVLKANLGDETVLPLAEWVSGQPIIKGNRSLELRYRIERVYPFGTLAGHLLGYTRLAKGPPEDVGYEINDLIGASGIERGLEESLRGHNGSRLIEMNAARDAVSQRVRQDAIPGKSITLTIDLKLQKVAENALKVGITDLNREAKHFGYPAMSQTRGALIALKPQTGEILALASSPSYDPNWFSRSPKPPELTKALLDLKYKPLWNRAAHVFEPGSTFKLITASTLLESNFGNRVYTCAPFIYWGGRRWRNWNRYQNMGPMDARLAIANSCNTWYYQAVAAFGPRAFAELLTKRAKEFGIGEASGLELVGEQTGELPSSPSQYAAKNQEWRPYRALNAAIGQDARANPLQIARMLATIVNDGNRPELTVIKAIDGKPVPRKPMTKLLGKHWKTLKEGMALTVSKGTAFYMLGPKYFPIVTGGKTGTAENPPNPDHSWYMGFGPLKNPDIVVVGFFENGFEGYGVALPAVKRLMAAYWNVPLDEQGRWQKNANAIAR